MPKTQTAIKDDELDTEEKILNPDLIVSEDGVEEADEEDGGLDEEDLDPFHDKWEE